MIHSINHQTVFEYATTQKSVVQRLHLKPLGTNQQHLMDWDVEVNGARLFWKRWIIMAIQFICAIKIRM